MTKPMLGRVPDPARIKWKLLRRCKACGAEAVYRRFRGFVFNSDELIWMHLVACSNPDCAKHTLPFVHRDVAFRIWNSEFGLPEANEVRKINGPKVAKAPGSVKKKRG